MRMSTVGELSVAEQQFLESYLPPGNASKRIARQTAHQDGPGTHSLSSTPTGASDMPFVTLTYASSLDSMISLAPGQRTTLSGPETKSMTHYLRMHHDAIIVGVGTAIPDDPGLNCRYPGASLDKQPRPVIVDPHLRWSVSGSKLEQIAKQGLGKAPWLIHLPIARTQRENLEEICGERILIAGDKAQSSAEYPVIPWISILTTLKQKGINSVMIEGGATVISTLLSMPALIDSVIITLAPTWLGQGGVVVSPPARMSGGARDNAARLRQVSWRQFGPDVVLCGRLEAGGIEAGT